jgi:hypothetical protein
MVGVVAVGSGAAALVGVVVEGAAVVVDPIVVLVVVVDVEAMLDDDVTETSEAGDPAPAHAASTDAARQPRSRRALAAGIRASTVTWLDHRSHRPRERCRWRRRRGHRRRP